VTVSLKSILYFHSRVLLHYRATWKNSHISYSGRHFVLSTCWCDARRHSSVTRYALDRQRACVETRRLSHQFTSSSSSSSSLLHQQQQQYRPTVISRHITYSAYIIDSRPSSISRQSIPRDNTFCSALFSLFDNYLNKRTYTYLPMPTGVKITKPSYRWQPRDIWAFWISSTLAKLSCSCCFLN